MPEIVKTGFMNERSGMKIERSGMGSERYRGHVSLCEIDVSGQAAIRGGSVLVVGAGGLGSPVCMYLCAAGVGKLGIVDADRVGLSNLQRQIMHYTKDLGRVKVDSAAETLAMINDEVEVVTYKMFFDGDTGGDLLKDYDVVVDCTDSACSRRTIAAVCELAGKPYVFGSVSRFKGMLFTYVPGSAGYGDIFTDESAGDEDGKGCAQTGILNALVGVVGSLQAAEVLKYLTGAGELLTNRLLLIDALTMDFTLLEIPRAV